MVCNEICSKSNLCIPFFVSKETQVPPQPTPRAVPHVWKYDQLRPQLLEAGRLISSEQAERRVLMLTNPALGKFNPHQLSYYFLIHSKMVSIRLIPSMAVCNSSIPVKPLRLIDIWLLQFGS
jgi:hypothetical protein